MTKDAHPSVNDLKSALGRQPKVETTATVSNNQGVPLPHVEAPPMPPVKEPRSVILDEIADHTEANRVKIESLFNDFNLYEKYKPMASTLANSTMVPDDFRGNPQNCMIALELAMRVNMSVLMVMQNIQIIYGKPTWTSKLIIALINQSGRYTPLKFRITEEPEARIIKGTIFIAKGQTKEVSINEKNKTCVAFAHDRLTGELVEGPPVSLEMAVKEGWYHKAGSKWQTMPELMLRYRAGSFFGNTNCSDILLGMQSYDEVADSTEEVITSEEQKTNVNDAINGVSES